MHEFGFNQALAGFLTTGIFATHAGMQIPGGHIVDRLGAKRVLFFALAWVALGNLGLAFAGAYWQLLACKIFTGMGTGVCFVGGARYIHQALAGPRLHVAQGFFGGSIQMGAGFVILAVPRLNLVAGWRVTFLVSAGMAVAAAIIWLAAAPTVAPIASPPGRFSEMLLAPQLWLLGLVQMATFGLSVVVGSWVVVMLTKVMKVPATEAGLIGSLVLLLGIVSRPLGGMLRRHMGIRPLLLVEPGDDRAGLLRVRHLADEPWHRAHGGSAHWHGRWLALRSHVLACRGAVSRPRRCRHGPGEHARHHHDSRRRAAGWPPRGFDGYLQGKLHRPRRLFAAGLRGGPADRPR